jgi:protein gp37
MSFNDSDIRWTDKTWNPVHGCSKTSEGCAHCYAERVSRKFGHTDYPWTSEHAAENVTLKDEMLRSDSLDGPAWVFVNSMSDLFHPQVPDEFVDAVLTRCALWERSAFQVLTKHAPDTERAAPPMPQNVMLGVSVESPERTSRIDWLRDQPAETRFVSFEPLVADVSDAVDLTGVDWAIIGGESHPDPDERREMHRRWVHNLIDECRRAEVPVFFKQHSGARPESRTRIALDDGRGLRRVEAFPDLPEGVVPAPREFLEEGVTV